MNETLRARAAATFAGLIEAVNCAMALVQLEIECRAYLRALIRARVSESDLAAIDAAMDKWHVNAADQRTAGRGVVEGVRKYLEETAAMFQAAEQRPPAAGAC